MKQPFEPTQQTSSKSGGLIFSLLFLLFSAFLISQITGETKFSSGGALVAQPRFWPFVAVVGMLLFGACHFVGSRRNISAGWVKELFTWARALEYLAWFMVYVAVVPIIGYLAATVIFTVTLAVRQGYRSKTNLLLAGLLGFAIVVIFKSFLSVKIPGGAIYEYLPNALRSFMILNF